jgi:mannosyltransferase OCH1-like enzyme
MKSYGQTWTEHHPGWELRQWGNDDITWLMPLYNQELYEKAYQLFPRNEYQFKADILRYELLLRYGGMYVDADFYCRRNLEPLIGDAEWFATWELQDQWIANGLMGSVPNHPFVAALVSGLHSRVARMKPGARPAQISGPQYVSHMYQEADHPERLPVLPQRHFYPYGHHDIRQHPVHEEFDDPELYAVHVWHNKRRERGLV